MARKARFVVSLSQPVPEGGTVTVHYATSNDTAVAPNDYTARSGTLVFTQGEQYKNLDIVLRDPETDIDNGLAQVEHLNLTLSNPSASAGIIPTIVSPAVRKAPLPLYSFLERFNWGYEKLQNPANGYFVWGYMSEQA